METNKLALKTVKVISQKIVPDWIHPYKNQSTSKSIGSGFFIDNDVDVGTTRRSRRPRFKARLISLSFCLSR